MNTILYPAIFTKEDDAVIVDFPDLCGCLTQGDNMQHAYEMAIDALGLYLIDMVEEKEEIPKPSELNELSFDNKDVVVYIPFDYLEYKKKYYNHAVKKTLSIPEWLNDLAMKNNVNFSQVLQEALYEKLGIS